MRKTMNACVFFIGLLIPAAVVSSQPAADGEWIKQAVTEAERIVLAGVEAGDGAAVRLARFLPPQAAYERVAGLLKDFKPLAGQKQAELRAAALESLYSIDPERTLRLLAARNDEVLSEIGPGRLAAIIGYDKLTRFENVFYFNLMHPNQAALAAPYLYTEWYLKTKDPKYLRLLTFIAIDPLASSEYLRELYEYFKRKNLPLAKIVLTMKYRGGVLAGRETVARTFSLDELLFQALLFRLGLTKTPYRTVFEVRNDYGISDERAAKKYGVAVIRTREIRDLSTFTAIPDLTLNDAAAHFYAGVPETRHFVAFVAHYLRVGPALRRRYVEVIASSPANELKEKLLVWFSTQGGADERRLAFSSCLKRADRAEAEKLLALVKGELDPGFRSLTYQRIAETGDRAAIRWLLDRLATESEAAVRIVIAGGILRLTGVKR